MITLTQAILWTWGIPDIIMRCDLASLGITPAILWTWGTPDIIKHFNIPR